MFAFRIGGSDVYKLLLEYGSDNSLGPSLVRLAPTQTVCSLEFEFTSDEAVDVVVQRFVQRQTALILGHGEEKLRVSLQVNSKSGHVTVTLLQQASYPILRCLQVSRVSSSGNVPEQTLKTLLQHCQMEAVWKLKGADGFGNFWSTCIDTPRLGNVRNLNLSYSNLTTIPPVIASLSNLKILRLSHNKLATLPAEIGSLTQLEVLAADANQLKSVPVELRHCSQLKELQLEANRIEAPVLDLRPMQHTLQSLQLFGNPLEYLPELSHCTQLRSLSLANVRIMADATYSRWEVEVGPLPYMARGHKLAPLFRLTFRRASLQHPLLAGALGRIAEDRASCELIAKEDVALQQLVLMALSENRVVVRQACKTLGYLAEFGVGTVKKLLMHDVLSAMQTLVHSPHQDLQLCGLDVLGSLASVSESIGGDIMTDDLLRRLQNLISTGDPSVRQAALGCLSALCYCPANRRAVRSVPGLLHSVAELARTHPNSRTNSLSSQPSNQQQQKEQAQQHDSQAAEAMLEAQLERAETAKQPFADAAHKAAEILPSVAQDSKQTEQSTEMAGPVAESQHAETNHRPVFASDQTRLSALRVLAVLGEHELLRVALQQPSIAGRGVRVLTLDGGGMKGVVLVQILRAIQARLPEPLHTYFDLVVGTSTGAIVAVSMAMLRLPLDGVEAIYTKLGQKVFNTARVSGSGSGGGAASEEQASNAGSGAGSGSGGGGGGWRESLYAMYKSSSQSVRVAVYGSKHDPSAFELLLQEFADMQKHGCLTDQMIDACSIAGTPKVGLVSTLTSVTPAQPFLFRTYELPPGSEVAAAHMAACPGSSRPPVWQAVRASASAPYYLDDFVIGEDRFQDGATTANNPALIAVQQAKLLWPELDIECVVSLGCGVPAPARRERSMSAYLEMGSILIESACSTDRVHEALATLLPAARTQYYRFHPIDERMGVELDDVSPASITKLQAAANDYCMAHAARLDQLADLLLSMPRDGGLPTVTSSRQAAERNVSIAVSGVAAVSAGLLSEGSEKLTMERLAENGPEPGLRLGRKRGLLVLSCPSEHFLSPKARPTPDYQSSTAAALASLPGLLRNTDLSQACHLLTSRKRSADASPFQDRDSRCQAKDASKRGRTSLDEVANGSAHPQPINAGEPQYVQLASDVERGLSQANKKSSFSFNKPDSSLPKGSHAKANVSSHPLQPETTKTSNQKSAVMKSFPPDITIPTRKSKDSASSVIQHVEGSSAPLQSQSSSSFLDMFLPSWGQSAKQPASDAPNLQTPAPTPTAAATAAHNPDLHQSQQMTTPTTGSEPITSPRATIGDSTRASVGSDWGGRLMWWGSNRQKEASTQPTTPTEQPNQSTTIASIRWFPWSSSAGPSSPVLSPTSSTALAEPDSRTDGAQQLTTHTAPPSHAANSEPRGPYLFRTRSKSEHATVFSDKKAEHTGLSITTRVSDAAPATNRSMDGVSWSHPQPSESPTVQPSFSRRKHNSHMPAPRTSWPSNQPLSNQMPITQAIQQHSSMDRDTMHQSATHLLGANGSAIMSKNSNAGFGNLESNMLGSSAGTNAADSTWQQNLLTWDVSQTPLPDTEGRPPQQSHADEDMAANQLPPQISVMCHEQEEEGKEQEEHLEALPDSTRTPPCSPIALPTSNQPSRYTRRQAANSRLQPHGTMLPAPTEQDSGPGRPNEDAEMTGGDEEQIQTNVGPTAGSVIQGLLQDLDDRLGVVHLALECDITHQGLVTQWVTQMIPVIEPGPDARQLLHKLGPGAAGQTLQRFSQAQPCFKIGSTTYTRLSAQEVMTPSGSQVCSLLFAACSPSQWLTAQEVTGCAVHWAGLLVTVSNIIPQPLLEAFLAVGVKAVVCCTQEPTPAQATALPAVMKAFISQAMSGAVLATALQSAETQQEGGICQGLLTCHMPGPH